MQKLISLGELIDQTWETYRKDFSGLMSIAAWLLVTALFSIIALAFFPSATKLQNIILGAGDFSNTEVVGAILVFVNKLIIGPILGLWVFTSLVRYVQKRLTTKRGNIKTAMREGMKYFFPSLYVTILFSLVLLFGVFVGIAPAVGLDMIAEYTNASGALIAIKNVLILLGLFASFVLVLRWIVYYSLAAYAVLMDDVRGPRALKKSREMIQGRYWAVVLRLVAPKLLFLGIASLALLALGYATDILISVAAGLNMDTQLRLSTMSSAVFPIIISVLINPLILITDILLYRNLEQNPVSSNAQKQEDKTTQSIS